MADRERITDFILSLEKGHGELCERIGRESRQNHVPIILPQTAPFLKTMVAAVRPRKILEVGTAVGYSALLMAQAMPKDGVITTIEKDGKRADLARKHLKEAGLEDRIVLIEGDAEEIFKHLSESYDFVFMDAAKGQYLHWLPQILELMNPGAVLFSDNVFQEGDIFESRFAVVRRDRTIHGRMRDYLYELKHRIELETSIIPIGDGVALSVKRKECCYEKG